MIIRVFGLSLCLHAIPTSVSGIITVINFDRLPPVALPPVAHPETGFTEALQIGVFVITFGIQAAIGIALIAMSQKIAGWMFKSNEE